MSGSGLLIKTIRCYHELMDEVLGLFNGYIVKTITKKIVQELISRFAFLGWGPFGWILSKIVENIVEKAYYYGELLVTDAILDNAINNNVENVNNLTDALLALENGDIELTDEEQDELDKDLIDAYRNLFNF